MQRFPRGLGIESTRHFAASDSSEHPRIHREIDLKQRPLRPDLTLVYFGLDLLRDLS